MTCRDPSKVIDMETAAILNAIVRNVITVGEGKQLLLIHGWCPAHAAHLLEVLPIAGEVVDLVETVFPIEGDIAA